MRRADSRNHYPAKSTLEAVLCFGCPLIETIHECFSWGTDSARPAQRSVGFEQELVYDMFQGDGGNVGDAFVKLRNEQLRELVRCLTRSHASQDWSLAVTEYFLKEHPISAFNENLRYFLASI